MSEQTNLRGSCQCGSVQYTVTGDVASFYLCHCTRCQKDTGSAHAANLFVKQGTLEYVKGGEFVSSYTVPNTRHKKYFCAQCACPVAGNVLGSEVLQIPAGSLDQAPELFPTAQIFFDSRAIWVDRYRNDSCQKFSQYPK